ncbi:hypothetical protein JHD48_01795 [Sulfurimonas sp. SAG-AH-194-I05]|nr:DUF5718 family protein [Sulfurimonas sp. SAG-AH-194-I05]MDF1874461.1 hypothetical protein [Sulfurimonas sp. SAG-AH-194-I05]
MSKYAKYLGLGIAGNFALHLAQAGELEEFKDIITAEEAAPKGMFPFYLPFPHANIQAKEILSTYPLSSHTIKLPKEKVNVQAEPEVALVCELTYDNNILCAIKPTHFGAYNDCSIRVAGANKISDKKNWGCSSKGFAQELISLDTFTDGSLMDTYSIASYLRRDNKVYAYGENVALRGYSYFYDTLTQWMLNQLNTQKDFGPLEPINEYIAACGNPTQAIISIGATRYTEYGEKTFLQTDDEIIIIVYNHDEISHDMLRTSVEKNEYTGKNISVLAQKII